MDAFPLCPAVHRGTHPIAAPDARGRLRRPESSKANHIPPRTMLWVGGCFALAQSLTTVQKKNFHL